MSKVSALARLCRELIFSIMLVSIAVLSTGCGGSSAASAPPPSGNEPPPVTPPPIEGVATPTSVAVVTATNAQ